MMGVLGGTFDPVHYGHLKTAHAAYRQVGLGSVRILPCYQPVHRESPIASADQRVAMLQLALQEFPEFELDVRELSRGGPSYSYDTLKSLHEDFPDAHLCFLIGADAFLQFTEWYRWQEILELAHLLVMVRPGYQILPGTRARELFQSYGASAQTELSKSAAGKILPVAVPKVDISSTVIRERLRSGESISGLVPAALEEWLQTQSIYRNQ